MHKSLEQASEIVIHNLYLMPLVLLFMHMLHNIGG